MKKSPANIKYEFSRPEVAKIKICGLTRPEDIHAANAAMPDYIGFVFAESRRRVTLAQACELRRLLHKNIISVGVFVDETIENILAAVKSGAISAVQLHGGEDEIFIEALQNALRDFPEKNLKIPIIKAVSISKKGDAQAWENSASDFLLLDRKGGGTGETFDWNLIGTVKKPFFLAGGLSAENVAHAVQQVKPFATDVSTGVEISPGIKCEEKIKNFTQLVKECGRE